jgi:TfoX/Sxy family transcriptional regulator of competence genes
MATSKDYLSFILEQLSELDEITHRSMMGEYIIYYRGKIAAYVCDNRFLVKPVNSAKDLMPNASLEPPYNGAKEMILVDNLDSKEFLKELFEAMYDELPLPKPKKKKAK